MEVREGRIEITQSPMISIDGRPLSETPMAVIAREIMALCKLVGEQREQIMKLRKELSKNAAN